MGKRSLGVDGSGCVVGGGNGADGSAGVAYGYRARGDVGCDDASGSYDAVVADGHAWQDAYLGTYPYVVADGDGACVFQPFVPVNGVDGVPGCVKSAVGGYEHVVAECDFRFVEYDEVEVGVEVLADSDVVAVVAMEWLLYEDVPGHFPE